MKRWLTCICVLLLMMAFPVMATEETLCTPLYIGTVKDISGLTAVYSVQTEQVKSIQVIFPEDIEGSKLANLTSDGLLKIVIASNTAFDLNGKEFQVTATLENGNVVAPELTLSKLKFDGKSVTENLIPGTITAETHGNDLNISVSACDNFAGNSYTMLIAAYQKDGKILGFRMNQISFSEAKKEKVFMAKLEDSSSAERVKVMFVDDTFSPKAMAIEKILN